MAAGLLAATSCTDFSDYNDVPVDQSSTTASQTLWETISTEPQLTNFKALLEQAGFNEELSKSRAYTVWAPVDGSYQLSDFQGLSKEDLLKQFVKSHVAEYNHQASGTVNERIRALNEKLFDFQGNGQYTYGGIPVEKANVPGTNGLMHFIKGAVKFCPNVYEYLKVATGVDSIQKYIMQYEVTRLDSSKSVKGPIVNGLQTWSDSVTVTLNTLTNSLRALVEKEDSSYTMLVPTNKAFNDMYNAVKPLYNYIDKAVAIDYEKMKSATDTTTLTNAVNIVDYIVSDEMKKKSADLQLSYLVDSLTRRTIVRSLFFSNNDAYNKWVVKKGENTDTLRSTPHTVREKDLDNHLAGRDLLRHKFSNPTELLTTYRVGDPVELSNGYAHIVDSLAFRPWEFYNKEKLLNPLAYTVRTFPANVSKSREVPDSTLRKIFSEETLKKHYDYFRKYQYLWVDSGGDFSKPDVFIALPEVRSAEYNFYVVYLPTAEREFGNDKRPSWLNYQLHYCTAKAKTSTYNFSKAYADSLLTGGKLPAVPKKVDTNTAFTNDPAKTDTVFIGRFKFPIAYEGMGIYPLLHISSPINVIRQNQKDMYTRDIRIAAIIMRPVEYDNFEPIIKNK